MNAELERAKMLLESENLTCVGIGKSEVFKSTERGVSPLLERLSAHKSFSGFYIADKVVGSAAAFLYLLLKAECIYAGVISKRALEILKNSGVCIEYGEITDVIINRKKTDICPMEKALAGCENENDALSIITETLKNIK